MMKAIFEDVRITLFIVLIIIVFVAIFGSLKDIAENQETKKVIEETEKSFITSMDILMVGIGIVGTIGIIILITSFLRD